ncbi:MAG TPA: class F sortase [Actinomycetota bacterium]|nr:class F sortase [Actinomycetota bacterium]
MSLFRRGKHRRIRRVRVPLSMASSVVALAIFASPGPSPTYARTAGPGALPYALHGGVHGSPGPTSGTAGTGGTQAQPGGTLVTAGTVAGSTGRFRVVIPSLGVDAAVIDLGLNPDGSLQVPSEFTVAGWYAGGPQPGQVGPAVIVGHVDSRNGPAVFYGLRSLAHGDTIEVFKGTREMRFTVVAVDEYPKDSFPTARVYGRVDYPAIRLITCGGVFNPATGHYSDNIVVFGKLA